MSHSRHVQPQTGRSVREPVNSSGQRLCHTKNQTGVAYRMISQLSTLSAAFNSGTLDPSHRLVVIIQRRCRYRGHRN